MSLGDGARLWLVEAASAGTSRIKTKMAQAVDLARLHGQMRVDWALGHAATYGFADGDLASILAAHPAASATPPRTTRCSPAPPPGPASEATNVDEVVDACAPQHRSCWPPSKAQRWEPAEAMHCSPRSSPAVKRPRSGPGAKRPGSPPASLGRDRVIDLRRPSGRCAGVDPPPREPRRVRTAQKTHFLEALGHAAVDAGHKITSFSLDTSERSCVATAPTTPQQSDASCEPTSS